MVDYAELKTAFKGDIVEPDSPDYAKAIARWAVNAERKARYVLFPKNDADVSLAVKFATLRKIPIAIRGGGHSTAGTSSVENGLCIDLSRYINTTTVDPDKKLAYVGGGALWETVDTEAIKYGLATPGGTVNHTGVGGLTLAGGYGWLTGEHGLVIDNLVQMTVVTANSSILTASETSHPDLFWGLRGGGSNFGVVTEFVLKLHPQRRMVFAGQLIFPPPLLAKVAELVDEWYAKAGEKEAILMPIARGPPPDRHPAVIVAVFYNGSEEEGRANFKQFYDLGPVVDMSREVPYEALNSILNQGTPHGRRYYMGGTTLRSKIAPQAQKVFEIVCAMSAAHPNPSSGLPPYNIMIAYELFPLGKVTSLPPDATAFRSRGPQPNVVVFVSWDKDEEGKNGAEHARLISHEISKAIESTAERPPKEDENDVYGNYVAEIDMPEKMRKLWGDNYPKLQRVKKAYDPDLVFNRWFPIQPAA